MRTRSSSPKGHSPKFSAHICCGQMALWIKMPLGMEVGLGPGHIVLDGEPAPPSQKGTQPPIFSACLLWPNGCMHQDATWYGGRFRPRPYCARWGPSSPSPKRGHSPQFSAHVCCGQTAGRIRMSLGTMVGLDPGNTVLDDNAAPSHKGHSPPQLRPMSVVAKRLDRSRCQLVRR